MNGEQTTCNGIIRPCCGDEANRVELIREPAPPNAVRVVEQCVVCLRKHYAMIVEPIRFGLAGAAIG